MAEKIRSKWQVRVAAVVIFVLGLVAGMLALHLYRGWAHRRPSPENRIERTRHAAATERRSKNESATDFRRHSPTVGRPA